MKMNRIAMAMTCSLVCVLTAQQAMAAIALDRTRVVFNGTEKSVSMNISNQNTQLPYLAQAWLEDAQGNKIQSPLTVLPPVQRVEPSAHSQVQVRGLPALSQLPQDRESLFYFNLREIPPRSDKPNTLQIALQTRIKLFYRPKAIVEGAASDQVPWQEKLTLVRQGSNYVAVNPTPYFVTLVDAKNGPAGKGLDKFSAVMVPPEGKMPLGISVSELGSSPVLTYVNDYGGRPDLKFSCAGNNCKVVPGKR